LPLTCRAQRGGAGQDRRQRGLILFWSELIHRNLVLGLAVLILCKSPAAIDNGHASYTAGLISLRREHHPWICSKRLPSCM
jgi:hypothetical protein